MKGNVVNNFIGVMIGGILIFAVLGPILGNATLGTEYLDETITNTSAGASYTILTTTCSAIRNDLTYVVGTNSTGSDITSELTVYDATTGQLKWTNTTYTLVSGTSNNTAIVDLDYRCYDSAYIDDNMSRTIANILLPLVIVILLVGLTALVV